MTDPDSPPLKPRICVLTDMDLIRRRMYESKLMERVDQGDLVITLVRAVHESDDLVNEVEMFRLDAHDGVLIIITNFSNAYLDAERCHTCILRVERLPVPILFVSPRSELPIVGVPEALRRPHVSLLASTDPQEILEAARQLIRAFNEVSAD